VKKYGAVARKRDIISQKATIYFQNDANYGAKQPQLGHQIPAKQYYLLT
jgi:hypothetical protein